MELHMWTTVQYISIGERHMPHNTKLRRPTGADTIHHHGTSQGDFGLLYTHTRARAQTALDRSISLEHM